MHNLEAEILSNPAIYSRTTLLALTFQVNMDLCASTALHCSQQPLYALMPPTSPQLDKYHGLIVRGQIRLPRYRFPVLHQRNSLGPRKP